MRVYEEMRRAVEGAAASRLPEVAQAMWAAYGAGGLTDEQAEQLDALMRARQGAAEAAPMPAPAGCEPVAPAYARKRGVSRTGSRPRSMESIARRRRWAAAGYMPPQLAAAFTQAESAALAVVAVEVGKRGTCALAIGAIAALAGVCPTIAKRALRLARTLGLVTIEERRVARRRNDTNLVRIVSREWASWLRLRLPRSLFGGIGGTLAPSTNNKVEKGSAEDRKWRPGSHQPNPSTQLALTGTA